MESGTGTGGEKCLITGLAGPGVRFADGRGGRTRRMIGSMTSTVVRIVCGMCILGGRVEGAEQD